MFAILKLYNYIIREYIVLMLVILYIWVLDIFLYSNTEIFLIFFIFSSFGIFMYTVLVWSRKYLEEFIIEENRIIYTSLYTIREKFIFLIDHTHAQPVALNRNSYLSFFSVLNNFFQVLVTAEKAKFFYNFYKKWVKYVQILLINLYHFELGNLRFLSVQEFDYFVESSINYVAAPEFSNSNAADTIYIESSIYSFINPFIYLSLFELIIENFKSFQLLAQTKTK